MSFVHSTLLALRAPPTRTAQAVPAAPCRTPNAACKAAERIEAPSSSLVGSSGSQRMMTTGRTAEGKKLSSKEVSTLRVLDMMTAPVMSLSPDMSVFDAMIIMVEKGISGMPVTDENNRVIGVCSGYDLLALDSTPGTLDKSFFPPIDTCINEFGGDRAMMWSNFKNLRRKLQTANCDTVGQAPFSKVVWGMPTLVCRSCINSPLRACQAFILNGVVMHSAFCININASMEDAASMVVQKRAHRICVVDDEGKLVGIVSRGDIMRATIVNFKVYMRAQDKKEEDKKEEGKKEAQVTA